jgi:predicted nucleotidyltransferase
MEQQDSDDVDRRDLLNREVERYVELLSREKDTVGIVLFGSLVTGNVNANSDVDLMIVKETTVPFWERLKLVRKLLRPRVATDILVYTRDELRAMWRGRPFVRQEIVERGKVLYERERGTLAGLCA